VTALVLFDVDGTLLLSGRAGVRAMTLAFERIFGVANAFEGVQIAGQTDSFLVSQALARAGLEDTREAHQQFRDAYLDLLADEILKPGTGTKGLMPGVHELLSQIAAGGEMHLALLTGNYERAARIKLEYFKLGQFFSWGAFGDEAHHRDELARLALARAETRRIPTAARANAIVIGDTPQDVQCARAIGARAIAVATGGYTMRELEVAQADVVLADLADIRAVMDVLAEAPGSRTQPAP